MKHAKRTRPENTAGKSSNQPQKPATLSEAEHLIFEANVFRWIGQLLRAGLERDKHPVASDGPLEHPRGVAMDSQLHNCKCRTGEEYRAKAFELHGIYLEGRGIAPAAASIQDQTERKGTQTTGAAQAGALPEAEPCYEGKQVSEGRNTHTEIAPHLSLWGCDSVSRAECLHYICEAVQENEAALREYAVHYYRGMRGDKVLAGENLVLLAVAKGIAKERKMGRGCTDAQFQALRVRFFELPGFLGQRGANADELLYMLSSFLYEARLVIEEKIINPMADRRKALKLAEAMVLVEELASCGGMETELEVDSSETRLIRLARQVLLEAMESGEVPKAA